MGLRHVRAAKSRITAVGAVLSEKVVVTGKPVPQLA
jgi:hypothetical protein